MRVVARFRITEAHEVHKDPGGHRHHWTVLVGVLERDSLCVADRLSIPRAGGGEWLARVVGFESFRTRLGTSITADEVRGRKIGVAVWAVAPPAKTVRAGDVATVVSEAEARVLAERLAREHPEVVEHCPDCGRIRE